MSYDTKIHGLREEYCKTTDDGERMVFFCALHYTCEKLLEERNEMLELLKVMTRGLLPEDRPLADAIKYQREYMAALKQARDLVKEKV